MFNRLCTGTLYPVSHYLELQNYTLCGITYLIYSSWDDYLGNLYFREAELYNKRNKSKVKEKRVNENKHIGHLIPYSCL